MRFPRGLRFATRAPLRARNERSSTPTDSIAMTGWKLFRIVITTIIHGRPGAAAIFQQSPFLIMNRAGRLSKLWAAPSPRTVSAIRTADRRRWLFCLCEHSRYVIEFDIAIRERNELFCNKMETEGTIVVNRVLETKIHFTCSSRVIKEKKKKISNDVRIVYLNCLHTRTH